jgi:hypothetical protein
MEQFPLGLFANATFVSGMVEVEPGDILALLTDGLPEVEDAGNEQFGMERIGKLVARNADGPLADLTETLFAAVRQFGRQTDDETFVLVRARASSPSVDLTPHLKRNLFDHLMGGGVAHARFAKRRQNHFPLGTPPSTGAIRRTSKRGIASLSAFKLDRSELVDILTPDLGLQRLPTE